MVNRGSPSKDCLPCRKRKLKCDLVVTGCGQCRRAGIQCVGYRAVNGVVFKDQTNAVAAKYLALPWPVRTELKVLPLCLEARARQSFFALYVYGFSTSHYALATLYRNASPDDELSTAVDAVGFALLSYESPSDAKVHSIATERYVKALRQVNASLRSARDVASDVTLQCVLLLDLYEKIMSRQRPCHDSWTAHVQGAASLVEARGEASVRSITSQRLAKRLYITLIISCAVARQGIPFNLDRLRNDLDRFQDPSDCKWKLSYINEQAINFRYNIVVGTFASPEDVLTAAEDLARQYDELDDRWPQRLIPELIHVPVHDKDYHLSFRGTYDLYLDHIITQYRNVLHSHRMHFHTLVPELASRHADRIDRWAEHICRSVPQLLIPSQNLENNSFPPDQVMKCITVLTPLYIAGQLTSATYVRNWILQTLDYMAETGGMSTAKMTAETLRYKPETEYWDVYAMLGGYAFAA